MQQPIDIIDPPPNQQHWHVSLSDALGIAQRAADTYSLPQTLYRDAQTSGWTSLEPTCTRLQRPGAELALTVLPSRYWS